jgi:hypothetical protein
MAILGGGQSIKRGGYGQAKADWQGALALAPVLTTLTRLTASGS